MPTVFERVKVQYVVIGGVVLLAIILIGSCFRGEKTTSETSAVQKNNPIQEKKTPIPESPDITKNWDQIKTGMSESEVEKVAGAPEKIDEKTDGKSEKEWTVDQMTMTSGIVKGEFVPAKYETTKYYVTFKDGKVYLKRKETGTKTGPQGTENKSQSGSSVPPQSGKSKASDVSVNNYANMEAMQLARYINDKLMPGQDFTTRALWQDAYNMLLCGQRFDARFTLQVEITKQYQDPKIRPAIETLISKL